MRGKLNFSGSDGEAKSDTREARQTAHAGVAGAEGWGAGAAVGEVGFSVRGDGVEEVEAGFSVRGDGVEVVEDALAVGVAGCGGVVVVEERHSLDGGTGRVWFGLRGLGRRESWLRVVGVGMDGREWSCCG